MKFNYKKSLLLTIPVSLLLVTTSCKKDKSPEPEEDTTTTPVNNDPPYTIPTSYNFTGVDFNTSTQRIAMLGEMTTYIKTAHTTTQTTQPTLDAQKLRRRICIHIFQFLSNNNRS